jgi:hypothetical protein
MKIKKVDDKKKTRLRRSKLNKKRREWREKCTIIKFEIS